MPARWGATGRLLRSHGARLPRIPHVATPLAARMAHPGHQTKREIEAPLARRRPNATGASRALFSWLRSPPEPPVARVGRGDDPYAWLQHGDEREIKKYLEAENRYFKAVLKPARKVERKLLSAMTERLSGEEVGDPERIEGWYYYMRTREGSAFPIYCRTKELGGEEQVLLDQDDMASRLPYLMVPQCKISPCHTMLAYTADTTGTERYAGFVKDLASGEIVCEVADVTTLEWATDGKTILYTQPDHHRRPYRVWRRLLREEGSDELILEEPDLAFYMDAGLTKDKQWITISLNSKTSSEVRLIRSSDPWAQPLLIQPRIAGLEYYVEHCRGNLLIVTNDREALDYKLVQTAVERADGDAVAHGGCGRETWRELLAPEPGCKIEDIDVFADHVAVYQRTSRGQQVRILDLEGGEDPDGCPAGGYQVGARGAQTTPSRAGEPDVNHRKGLVMYSASCGFPHDTLDEPPSRGSVETPRQSEALEADKAEGAPGVADSRGLRITADTMVALPFDEVGTCIQPGANCDYAGSLLRLSLSSPLSPWTVVDVSLRTELRAQLGGVQRAAEDGAKQVTVIRQRTCSGFEPRDFVCRQEWATSRDGTQESLVCLPHLVTPTVPMTVMHRRDFPLDGSRPALLITYGGYGQCLDTDFDVGRLVMMENGWAVILCHVRGGGELGGRWHAAGRGAHKLNSVYDLAACVRWVSSSGLSSAPKIALHTASAGGLVVGAFLNMFQGLVGAAVVKVPFVDVANTMLDPSLPLTVHEYDEWGNTREPAVAAFLRSYSPYDNVKHGHAYPSLYITGAFNDTRVAYWEPGALPHLLRPLTVRQYIKS